jgi:hypothetical protein
MSKLREDIIISLYLIYDFIRNPFSKPIDDIDDDKKLVMIASILSGFTVFVRFFNTPMNNWGHFAYLIGALLLTPLFGLLVVHFKGNIYGLYLTFIAKPIFNIDLNDFLKAKQIATFSTIGLIVSSVPSLTYIGFTIGLIIEIIGLYKLFQIKLINAFLIAALYFGLWRGLIFLIAKGTAWL